MILNLIFPVQGEQIPLDHAYALYGALSRIIPEIHESGSAIRFAPIRGVKGAPRRLHLTKDSRLILRLPIEQMRSAIPLAGKSLKLNDAHIRLGTPNVASLLPAPILTARMVTFKHADDWDKFLIAARKFLDVRGIRGQVSAPIQRNSANPPRPLRRVVRIKNKTIYGYALQISDLTDQESLDLQENGLGGRTKMGCGFFGPVRGKKNG